MMYVIWFGVNWNNIWARLWKMIILGPLWWVDRSSWKAVEGSGLLGSKRIISSGHLHCPLSGATSRLPTQVSRQGAKLTRDPEKSAQMALGPRSFRSRSLPGILAMDIGRTQLAAQVLANRRIPFPTLLRNRRNLKNQVEYLLFSNSGSWTPRKQGFDLFSSSNK